MTTTYNMSDRTRTAAGALVFAVTRAAARLVALVRPLQECPLSDAECEAQGLELGSTEPAVFCWPVTDANPWRVDVWLDQEGSGCLNIRALGWAGEVHYQRSELAAC